MINFQETLLDRVVIHKIGNKVQEQPLSLSEYEISIHDETINELLMTYFLSSFKKNAFYHFSSEMELHDNVIYKSAMAIFDHPTHNFYEQSKIIANHLYEKSTHPNIKIGDMYLVYFTDCVVGDDICDAIGIFKSENKESFIKVYQKNNTFDVDHDTGVNINKLDKGCIIFDLEDDKGFKVAIVDKTNKQEEAVYWKENFLELVPRKDSYYSTLNEMTICKDFVQDVYNSEHNVPMHEQIDMINKTVQYFEGNEAFDTHSFEENVLRGHPEIIDAYKDYKETYKEDRDIITFDEFDIAPDAVKGIKSQFKSVIKLDKNFEIKLLGGQERIERDYDAELDLNYYKLYFKRES